MNNWPFAQPLPTFLDYEASSLDSDSYPIEVAWNIGDVIESHLITPCAKWTDWNPKSEKIHGIPREELFKNGKPISFVVQRMQSELSGKLILSDNPDYEWFWTKTLFDANRADPEFSFIQTYHHHPIEIVSTPELVADYPLWKEEARNMSGSRHRADNDVRYFINLWKIMAREYIKYMRNK